MGFSGMAARNFWPTISIRRSRMHLGCHRTMTQFDYSCCAPSHSRSREQHGRSSLHSHLYPSVYRQLALFVCLRLCRARGTASAWRMPSPRSPQQGYHPTRPSRRPCYCLGCWYSNRCREDQGRAWVASSGCRASYLSSIESCCFVPYMTLVTYARLAASD